MKCADAETGGRIDRQFISGITKLIILGKIRKTGTHPYEIYKEIKDHPFAPIRGISKSDVYNTIKALETMGLISGKPGLVGSKMQKKYHLTKQGAEVSGRAKKILSAHLNDIKRLIAYEFK